MAYIIFLNVFQLKYHIGIYSILFIIYFSWFLWITIDGYVKIKNESLLFTGDKDENEW